MVKIRQKEMMAVKKKKVNNINLCALGKMPSAFFLES